MKDKFFTLADLAEFTQTRLVGNPGHIIRNVADLDSANEEDASFLARPAFGQSSRYEQAMLRSSAGVIFVHPDAPLPEGKNYLLSEDPSRSFQITLEALHGDRELTGFKGIHPTAVIHETVRFGNNVSIGPYAVIDKEVIIGDSTHVGPGCYIGPGCTIGKNCIFHSHATIREQCQIGNDVILQPGAVIGSCGFGYTTSPEGRHLKLNQIGNVILEDDVEIGANTTIDRGRFKPTRIKKGTKIDNLVQIGHGVTVGEHNLIAAQSGIAGSSTTGRYVVLAGQCGVSGHIHLDDHVIMSAKSGVDKSIKGGKYGGAPVMPMAEYNRMSVHLRHIEKYVQQIKDLEARLAKLESQI